MSTAPVAERLQAGRDAAARHAWGEAFDLLAAADATEELPPEDLERLAETAQWTGRYGRSLDALERAYAAYLTSGNHRRAGFIALMLAREYKVKLARSISAGWFSRAERLLQEQSDSAEYGYLALAHSSAALAAGDPQRAVEAAQRAGETGRRFGDRDLEALALHHQGRVLIREGRLADGLALLDEASVAAVGGELGTKAAAIIYCNTISTCRDLADYGRAGEWTEAARRWCARKAIAGFPGICRVHRAEVMRFRGDWSEAEAEVRRACEELQEFSLEVAAEGFYELGEIRLHLGDHAGAEEGFRRAHELGREPQPGLALLRLAEGKTEAASAAIRRALADGPQDRLFRARVLPAYVEIAMAAGDTKAAREAADELESTAATYGTAALEATALTARGSVQLAEEAPAAAVATLRRAVELWRAVEAPYDAARARLRLGLAYRATNDEEAAKLEIAAARAAFHRLGAVPDERRAAELLPPADSPALDGAAVERAVRETRTFLFTDIAGSTSLVEVIGDEAWEDLRRWHDRTLRDLFAAHGGTEVNHAGDGFFVSFVDSGAALSCAVAIQRALADHRRTHGFAPHVRIGVHEAEAGRRGGDYEGRGVHEAARIGALAEGGEILASTATFERAAGTLGASEPRTVVLKGLTTPCEVVAVSWR